MGVRVDIKHSVTILGKANGKMLRTLEAEIIVDHRQNDHVMLLIGSRQFDSSIAGKQFSECFAGCRSRYFCRVCPILKLGQKFFISARNESCTLQQRSMYLLIHRVIQCCAVGIAGEMIPDFLFRNSIRKRNISGPSQQQHRGLNLKRTQQFRLRHKQQTLGNLLYTSYIIARQQTQPPGFCHFMKQKICIIYCPAILHARRCQNTLCRNRANLAHDFPAYVGLTELICNRRKTRPIITDIFQKCTFQEAYVF